MSDMKKVFVTLVDADGVEHRVAGYGYVDGRSFQSENDSNIINEIGNWWYAEFGGALKVEPAPEPLPTGLGAVVHFDRVETNNSPITLVRASKYTWNNGELRNALWTNSEVQELMTEGNHFKVLSAGVEL